MTPDRGDLVYGSLGLLVLKTLDAMGPMHGYGLTTNIERISGRALRLQEGSLYPALHRMTECGWLRADWRASENGRRARFYQITAAGRRQLADEEQRWAELTGAVARVLRHA